MKTNVCSLVILWLIFSSFVASRGYAFEASADSQEPSIDWQKLKLEEMIQARTSHLLATLIASQDFYVQVEIKTKDQAKLPVQPVASSVSLGKLDMSVEVSGIHANESGTVFNVLERIDIVATVPKAVFEANKDLIQNTLSSALRSFTHAPVGVRVEPLILAVTAHDPAADAKKTAADAKKDPKKDGAEATPKPDAKPGENAGWKSELPKQMLALTIFLASLLMAGIMYRLVSVYRTVEMRKTDALEKQASRLSSRFETPEKSRSKDDATPAGSAISAIANTPQQNKMDEQIRQVVESSPKNFITLLHRWLSGDDEASVEALCSLPSILPMNSLLKLVEKLDEKSKRNWRLAFEKELEEGFETRARVQIFQQLVAGIMDDASPASDEIRQFLEGIRPDECAEIAQTQTELGAVLAKILSTPQTARMLSLMPEDLAGQVAVNSLDVSADAIEKALPDLRRLIAKVRHGIVDATPSSFERAIELLREVGPHKEMMLFSGFAMNFNAAEMRQIVRSVCPVEVIVRAPSTAHRLCLADIPLTQRAELIYSLKADLRQLLLGSYAPEEKIHELLEAEISQIDLDTNRKQKTVRDADKLWRNYVSQFRRLTQTNTELASSLQPVMDTWIETQLSSAQTRDRGLHAA